MPYSPLSSLALFVEIMIITINIIIIIIITYYFPSLNYWYYSGYISGLQQGDGLGGRDSHKNVVFWVVKFSHSPGGLPRDKKSHNVNSRWTKPWLMIPSQVAQGLVSCHFRNLHWSTLEVPTIYKVSISGLNFRRDTSKMWLLDIPPVGL